jgi:hypothetical protein
MKPKIIVFKTLVALIAVIGAIASVNASGSLVATSAYVHYTTATNATIRTYCAKCGTCDRPGTLACVATVTIAGTSTSYVLRRLINNACATVQVDTDAAIDCTIVLPPTSTPL